MQNIISELFSTGGRFSLETGIIDSQLTSNRYSVIVNGSTLNVATLASLQFRFGDQVVIGTTQEGKKYILDKTDKLKAQEFIEIVIDG